MPDKDGSHNCYNNQKQIRIHQNIHHHRDTIAPFAASHNQPASDPIHNHNYITTMATSKRVSCITKGKGTEHWNHITHIGGGSGSTKWTRTEPAAIKQLKSTDSDAERYHVNVNDKDVKVIVATITESNGTKHEYLKTEADGYKPNNLLSLDICS